MDPREHWRTVYGTRRPDEVSWYQAVPEPSLDAFDRVGVKPTMAVVDVGAGASLLADALLDRGYADVTLVDIADTALEAGRQRLGRRAGKVHWEVADVRDWHPARRFDVWHDRAVFHFLTEADDRDGYRRALFEGTHPGSLVILATFALDGPQQCSGLPVRRYDADTLAAEFGEDFTLLEAWLQPHETPWGTEQSFQWAVFQRG
jgi:2-polyprenyl-3-methyl-5-hydroxy-6-metoxy-1,4-benzoquinol methylase